MHAHLSHVLLCCEHQFVVDQPFWKLLEETAVGMDVDRLLMLDSLIEPSLGEARSVVEIACGDSLRAERYRQVVVKDGEG